MPNMFGGDQFHPAYDPRTELTARQVMVGNDLHTIEADGSVTVEAVSGVITHVAAPYHPDVIALREKLMGPQPPTMQDQIEQHEQDRLIDKLIPGYELGDMHYSGLIQELKGELGEYEVQSTTTLGCRTGADLISGMVKQHRNDGWFYTNKMLVILEYPTSQNGTWLIKAGWSYDAHTLGIVVITIPKK